MALKGIIEKEAVVIEHYDELYFKIQTTMPKIEFFKSGIRYSPFDKEKTPINFKNNLFSKSKKEGYLPIKGNFYIYNLKRGYSFKELFEVLWHYYSPLNRDYFPENYFIINLNPEYYRRKKRKKSKPFKKLTLHYLKEDESLEEILNKTLKFFNYKAKGKIKNKKISEELFYLTLKYSSRIFFNTIIIYLSAYPNSSYEEALTQLLTERYKHGIEPMGYIGTSINEIKELFNENNIFMGKIVE